MLTFELFQVRSVGCCLFCQQDACADFVSLIRLMGGLGIRPKEIFLEGFSDYSSHVFQFLCVNVGDRRRPSETITADLLACRLLPRSLYRRKCSAKLSLSFSLTQR